MKMCGFVNLWGQKYNVGFPILFLGMSSENETKWELKNHLMPLRETLLAEMKILVYRP